jgi:hypothetical protein
LALADSHMERDVGGEVGGLEGESRTQGECKTERYQTAPNKGHPLARLNFTAKHWNPRDKSFRQ